MSLIDLDCLLTIPEVSDRLRCSKAHVYRLISANLLQTVDIGVPGSKRAKTRIREQDITAYIQGCIAADNRHTT